MKYIQIFCLSTTVLLFFSQSTQAVTILQCEDEQGNISFQDRCPPGTKEVGAKDYKTRGSGDDSATYTGPATLYRIAECDGCDQIKEFMTARNIRVIEKNVSDNEEYRKELQEKTGGELKVPTILIGDSTVVGYNRSKMLSALSDAGYRLTERDGDEEDDET